MEKGELKLMVTIPPNTEAEVVLPTTRPETVSRDGKPLATDGIRRTRIAGVERTAAILPSGRYEFRIPLAH
jgi:hypothetical protein